MTLVEINICIQKLYSFTIRIDVLDPLDKIVNLLTPNRVCKSHVISKRHVPSLPSALMLTSKGTKPHKKKVCCCVYPLRYLIIRRQS